MLSSGVLVVQHGVVLYCGASLPEQFAGAKVIEVDMLFPGFVDIHCHGYGGTQNVLTYWTKPGASLEYAARHCTTSILATLTLPGSGPCCMEEAVSGEEKSKEGCGESPLIDPEVASVLNDTVGKRLPGCCILEGIHLEGPVVADLGGLPQSEQDMALDRFRQLLDALPFLRMMTISPTMELRAVSGNIVTVVSTELSGFGHCTGRTAYL